MLTAVYYCSGSTARSLDPLEANRTSKTRLISIKITIINKNLLKQKANATTPQEKRLEQWFSSRHLFAHFIVHRTSEGI